MGSSQPPKSASLNSIRLLSGVAAAQTTGSAQSTPIEKLVEQLGFANPQAAAQFLQSHPGILGQTRLMSSLDDQFN